MMRIKKFLKYIFAAAVVYGTFCSCAAGTEYIKNDGFITMEGSMPLEAENSEISAVICQYPAEWTNEEEWEKGNADGVEFYDVINIDSEKKYCFRFVLEKSGVYNVYIASKTSGVEKKVIGFINRDKNETLVSEILSAQSRDALKNIILSDEIENLGIFDFNSEIINRNINDIVEIVYKEIENKGGISTDGLQTVFEKACLAAQINSGELKNFSDYKFLKIYDGEIFKYINSANEKYIIDAMSKKTILSVSEFDKCLTENTVLSIANNEKNITLLKEILNKYRETIGITKTVTDNMCNAIIKGSPFESSLTLASFASGYSEGGNDSGAGGGGAGGGGSGGGSGGSGLTNRYNNTEYEEDKSERTVPQELNAFDDISEVPWAISEINALYKKGIINGRSERLFCPNESITREEFTKLLMLGFNVDLIGGELPFSDVSETDWAYNFIKTAYLAGIVKGIDEEHFGRELNISRQDLCVMVFRIIKAADESVSGSNSESMYFGDYEKISGYASEAIGFLKTAGIISGDENGNFNPHSDSTRAEAAKIIYKAMKQFKK